MNPAIFHADKLPKETDAMKLDLLPTPDIAATLGAQKTAGQINIGFALQNGRRTSSG